MKSQWGWCLLMVELFLPVAQTLVDTTLCKCLGGSLRGGGRESSDVQSLSFEKRSDSALQRWLADQSPSPKSSS